MTYSLTENLFPVIDSSQIDADDTFAAVDAVEELFENLRLSNRFTVDILQARVGEDTENAPVIDNLHAEVVARFYREGELFLVLGGGFVFNATLMIRRVREELTRRTEEG